MFGALSVYISVFWYDLVPDSGKIPNGTDVMMSPMGHMDSEGKSQWCVCVYHLEVEA
jgi:hypothetical protein